jgi:hypothetical protein
LRKKINAVELKDKAMIAELNRELDATKATLAKALEDIAQLKVP